MSRIVQPCGTRAAAMRHYRNGEPYCPACHDAMRAYSRELQRKRYRKQWAVVVDEPTLQVFGPYMARRTAERVAADLAGARVAAIVRDAPLPAP